MHLCCAAMVVGLLVPKLGMKPTLPLGPSSELASFCTRTLVASCSSGEQTALPHKKLYMGTCKPLHALSHLCTMPGATLIEAGWLIRRGPMASRCAPPPPGTANGRVLPEAFVLRVMGPVTKVLLLKLQH